MELAQRLSLELTTVSIDPAWDVNKWTMCFGRDYCARAERGDLRLIYSSLEEELTSDKRFDAILLPLVHGRKRLTPRSRQAIERNRGTRRRLAHPRARRRQRARGGVAALDSAGPATLHYAQ